MFVRVIKCWTLVGVVFVVASCANYGKYDRYNTVKTKAETTYARILVLAVAGDLQSQNLLGFMLAFGEETDVDLVEAHHWFHRAAEAGHPLAQQNDLYIHEWLDTDSTGVLTGESTGQIEEATLRQVLSSGIEEAGEPATLAGTGRIARSEKNYMTFCGGCHGFNGIAAYVESPSFALNERLEKSDQELFQNISRGIGGCPGWEDILPDQDLMDMIAFIRSFRRPFEMGIAHSPREAPSNYLLFGAMSKDFTDL